MFEQPQRLARTADRSNVSLQVLPLDGPQPVSGELFAIFRFEADGEAVLLGVVSSGHLRNGLSPGRQEARQHRIGAGRPAKVSPGAERSKEHIRKTAESLWPGAQREP
jgi:Domain of unknown function (DUF5753)